MKYNLSNFFTKDNFQRIMNRTITRWYYYTNNPIKGASLKKCYKEAIETTQFERNNSDDITSTLITNNELD